MAEKKKEDKTDDLDARLKKLTDEHNKESKEEKKEEKSKKSTANGTEAFKKAIMDNLREECKTDKLLFDRIKNNKDKNIDDCITYIFNQVRKSGCIGYAQDEIYQLARHYYDEDDIEVGQPITRGEVIVNRQISLSPEEIANAKEKAVREIISEEKARLKKKPENKSTVTAATKKKEAEEGNLGTQSSLF
jgi:hypothetical protein